MDLSEYEAPSILFLEGCFLSECSNIEDQFDERLMIESRDTYDIDEVVYDKIPARYIDFKSWRKKTNLKCWACELHFYEVPKFLPLVIHPSRDPAKQHGGMDVHGNFCSWPCAATRIELYFKHKKRIMYDMLYFLYFDFCGKRISFIPQAIDKTEMKQFGGSMSISEYKKKNAELIEKHTSSINNSKIKNMKLQEETTEKTLKSKN